MAAKILIKISRSVVSLNFDYSAIKVCNMIEYFDVR